MFFKKLDVFPKFSDPDVKVKTRGGAFLSVLTISAMTILFFHELYRFAKPRVFDTISVDTSRVGLGRTMDVNFNISIYCPCNNLHVSAWDTDGNKQSGKWEVYVQKIDENGLAIGGKQWLAMKRKEKKHPNQKKAEKPDFCGSCYGAGEKGQCCNSCDDVIEAFRKKGWDMNGIDRWQQCVDEGYTNFGKESCLVSGSVRVKMVKGALMISLLDDYKPGKGSYDVSRISKSLNLSHTFHYFEFGTKVPNSKHPLDGITVLQEQKGRVSYNYRMNVVPQKYIARRGLEINTYMFNPVFNQYNITTDNSQRVPGIYFEYDIAPFSVISTEKAYSVWQFVTSVCAIVGGAFTCASLADQFFFRALTTIEGKRRIGKLF